MLGRMALKMKQGALYCGTLDFRFIIIAINDDRCLPFVVQQRVVTEEAGERTGSDGIAHKLRPRSGDAQWPLSKRSKKASIAMCQIRDGGIRFRAFQIDRTDKGENRSNLFIETRLKYHGSPL